LIHRLIIGNLTARVYRIARGTTTGTIDSIHSLSTLNTVAEGSVEINHQSIASLVSILNTWHCIANPNGALESEWQRWETACSDRNLTKRGAFVDTSFCFHFQFQVRAFLRHWIYSAFR